VEHLLMPSEAAFLEIVSGRRRDWAAMMARGGLACAEPCYAAVAAFRNSLFDLGWKRSRSAGEVVVSVGNLTTGGTGKTPVVGAVVEELRRRGLRPGIASRGYRSLDDAGNDEKRVLDLLCPGAPHVQNRDRVAAAIELVEKGVNAVVLDDGFQHRRLRRDLDLVLVDATNPWGYGHLLPRGLLRESVRGLRRAGLVIVTRADLVSADDRDRICGVVRQHTAAPFVTSRFIPHGLRARAGETEACDSWNGRRVVAFCGIGNPAAFRATLDRIGLALPTHTVTAFPDHHHYTADDLTRLVAEAEATHAEALVCTLKDLVKLPPIEMTLPIVAVEIGFDILDGAEAWKAALDRVARGVKSPASAK
jgi:tetraacyldisaccharide 4'-kinase